MNESIFFLHVVLMMGFGFLALRMGAAALTAWAAIQAVLANLFVIKQIDFFGFHVTCSDVFAIGSILGLNFLREYYGKQAANKALWICFSSMIFFVAMAQIHLLYVPNGFDTTQESFNTILSASPRLLFASLGVFFLVQQFDLRLFGFLQSRFSNLTLGIRNAITLFFSQLIDTVLFSIAGLWGIAEDLTDIIIISFLIKLLVIALSTPLLTLSKRFVHVTHTQ